MPSLKDFMPEPVPPGWTLARRAAFRGIEVVVFVRESDRLNVSMSWEDEGERPHLHMTFAKLRQRPTSEQVLEAARTLLPKQWIQDFQLLSQPTDVHKPTIHARVYLRPAL